MDDNAPTTPGKRRARWSLRKWLKNTDGTFWDRLMDLIFNVLAK